MTEEVATVNSPLAETNDRLMASETAVVDVVGGGGEEKPPRQLLKWMS